MLKTILLIAACGASAFVGSSARTIYSALQPAFPVGSSIKVTPDPASIWSWHETATAQPGETITLPVLVDFNGDGVMDSNNPAVRVLVTDATATRSGVEIHDDAGELWVVNPVGGAEHFSTPLMVPVGSGLTVKWTGGSSAAPITVHLIGRIVNL